MDQKHYKRFKR